MELIYCGYCRGEGCSVCRKKQRLAENGWDTSSHGPNWTMDDELTFIRNLGRWQIGQHNALNRADLLKGYLGGLTKRRVWVNLEPERLRQTALQLLVENG